jgi:heme/copper-type cytochrome/quinol oxidase subunit 3
MTAESRREPVMGRTVSGPRSFAWWGMVWLIMTESALFAMLIFSYFFLRFRQPAWPPEGITPPDLTLPLIMTVILWSSSLPVHLAERGIVRDSQRWLRGGLLAGFILGATFLSLQVFVEYPSTLTEFTPQSNVYGSLFFVITGFHGFHVIVGLLFSLWVQTRAWAGSFSADRHVTVQNFTLYWHFVDIVWLFVLLTVYISPHL